jgi:hypothetical protein
MARDFRRPERRQSFLLPPDMQDWLPEDEPKATPAGRYIVHLVLDAVSLMDLSGFEAEHRVGGVGQAPFVPSMLLALPIDAYSHGVRLSRAIERLCRPDAGAQRRAGTLRQRPALRRLARPHRAPSARTRWGPGRSCTPPPAARAGCPTKRASWGPRQARCARRVALAARAAGAQAAQARRSGTRQQDRPHRLGDDGTRRSGCRRVAACSASCAPSEDGPSTPVAARQWSRSWAR